MAFPIDMLRMRKPVSASGDVQNVGTGTFGTSPNRFRGYSAASSFGTISDGTFNPLSNATILTLYWVESSNSFWFEVAGLFPNSGWTSMDIAGVQTLTRASGTYAQVGGNTRWTWTGFSYTAATNPFLTAGQMRVVTFT